MNSGKVIFSVGRNGHGLTAKIPLALTPEQAAVEHLIKRWGREKAAQRLIKSGLYIFDQEYAYRDPQRVSDEVLEGILYA